MQSVWEDDTHTPISHECGGRGGSPRAGSEVRITYAPNSLLPPGSTRVSGRASALLGVAGLSLATHRPLLCGGPTYGIRSPHDWHHAAVGNCC